MRTKDKLVFSWMTPNEWPRLAAAHTDAGHKLARAVDVAPAEIRVRRLQYHQMLVVIPIAAARSTGSLIVAHSAILARLTEVRTELNGTVEISYEGAIHGQAMSFSQKLLHAAGRMIENYPSIARAWVPVNSVEPVGLYALREDYQDSRLWIWNRAALDEWAGEETDKIA